MHEKTVSGSKINSNSRCNRSRDWGQGGQISRCQNISLFKADFKREGGEKKDAMVRGHLALLQRWIRSCVYTRRIIGRNGRSHDLKNMSPLVDDFRSRNAYAQKGRNNGQWEVVVQPQLSHSIVPQVYACIFSQFQTSDGGQNW
uniref:Uncharacterized protein n=1 Tax=Araneus ventricosus TaxID=182803 RepID=A0A4Y2LYA1_ARAVE|nr:hypothetical protein AVEN_252114-1 [Araneus ventricosus]